MAARKPVEPQTNVAALEVTIKALTGLGPEDAALVQHARTLADLVDTYSTDSRSHAEYRETLRRLMVAGEPEETDEMDAVLAEIRD